MKKRLAQGLVIIVALITVIGTGSAQDVIEVWPDWESPGEPVDRHLFSIVNYARLYSEGNELAQSVFEELNPNNMQTRIEVWISLMQPEKGDDDPYYYNWSDYDLSAMFRHVDDSLNGFLPQVEGLGMDPMLLLAYNVEWLGRDGSRIDPPYDNELWARFATAALHASEMKAPGLVQYVEIWNEPSENGLYWSGTEEEFFELFEAAQRRIKDEFPHVKVGGPSVLGQQNPFFRRFIDRFGHDVDFLTIHFYNDPAHLLIRKIEGWGEYIRNTTGRDDLRLMITEADNWNLQGDDKVRYLLERQFGLLGLSRYLEGFHQFHLTRYGEGGDSARFGFLHNDGAIMEKNYWGYWLFRDYDGLQIEADVISDNVVVYSSVMDDQDKKTVLTYVSPQAETEEKVRVFFPQTANRQKLVISSVDGLDSGFSEVRIIEPGDGEAYADVTVYPGAGVALTASPLESQPKFLVRVDWQQREARVGQQNQAMVSVWNTSSQALSATMELKGFPGEYTADEPLELPTLEPGEVYHQTIPLVFSEATVPEGNAVWFEIYVSGEESRVGRSLPEKIIVRR